VRPETLRRRVEALQQRRLDAIPPAPVPVVVAQAGESPADARKRLGIAPDAFTVIVETTDMSVPRPD